MCAKRYDTVQQDSIILCSMADDPAIVIEPLNGYRQKERRPENMGEFKLALGIPEIISEGSDITVVSYGSTLKVAMDAVEQLKKHDISVELIDVQTLLPFDMNNMILESIKKTGSTVPR